MGSCKHRTEVYSRVVGYYRPVQQWNKGKQAEYADRVPFKLANAKFGMRNVGASRHGVTAPDDPTPDRGSQ